MDYFHSLGLGLGTSECPRGSNLAIKLSSGDALRSANLLRRSMKHVSFFLIHPSDIPELSEQYNRGTVIISCHKMTQESRTLSLRRNGKDKNPVYKKGDFVLDTLLHLLTTYVDYLFCARHCAGCCDTIITNETLPSPRGSWSSGETDTETSL